MLISLVINDLVSQKEIMARWIINSLIMGQKVINNPSFHGDAKRR